MVGGEMEDKRWGMSSGVVKSSLNLCPHLYFLPACLPIFLWGCLVSCQVILGEWRPEVKLTRVTQARGKMLTSMGITFDKANHLLPEETLFLLERAYLMVKNVTREELYAIVGVPAYLTYAYYKKLGYAVLRASSEVAPHVPTRQGEGLSISFRLFPPNQRFSKRDPGTPTALVAIARYGKHAHHPPSHWLSPAPLAIPIIFIFHRLIMHDLGAPAPPPPLPHHLSADGRDRFGIPTRQQMEEVVAESTTITPPPASPAPVLHVALVSDDGGVFPFEIRPNVPPVAPSPPPS